MYLAGVILFFTAVIGGPIAYKIISIPETCFDGKQNQDETAIDKGGPCVLLDERHLAPHAVQWARSFEVRPGIYTAVAYISNPNPEAGVRVAHYRFGLYDSQNVLVAERTGTTFIMPGGITPVLEGPIETGNREVVHTYLQITDEPLVWERMVNPAEQIKISNQQLTDSPVGPRVDARATNIGLDILRNPTFIVTVFDPVGNAFSASGTALPSISPDMPVGISFTWPLPFQFPIGRIDIIPLLPPQ
ncbi:hypothetical protein C4568_00035 [Candidatus Parcubacteria bacterium]|nr:MAG: hypothetical protein C4568_00035 [Candidatus Parcubacteria bacterium]